MPYPKFAPPTEVCRCRACGGEDPMGCGNICADCAWEDHCDGYFSCATVDHAPTHEATPTCCRTSAEAHEISVEVWKNNNPTLI